METYITLYIMFILFFTLSLIVHTCLRILTPTRRIKQDCSISGISSMTSGREVRIDSDFSKFHAMSSDQDRQSNQDIWLDVMEEYFENRYPDPAKYYRPLPD